MNEAIWSESLCSLDAASHGCRRPRCAEPHGCKGLHPSTVSQHLQLHSNECSMRHNVVLLSSSVLFIDRRVQQSYKLRWHQTSAGKRANYPAEGNNVAVCPCMCLWERATELKSPMLMTALRGPTTPLPTPPPNSLMHLLTGARLRTQCRHSSQKVAPMP